MSNKNKNEHEKPKVHENLKGFDIKINHLGEMESNVNIDKINEFLNENTEDKKIINAKTAEEEE